MYISRIYAYIKFAIYLLHRRSASEKVHSPADPHSLPRIRFGRCRIWPAECHRAAICGLRCDECSGSSHFWELIAAFDLPEATQGEQRTRCGQGAEAASCWRAKGLPAWEGESAAPPPRGAPPESSRGQRRRERHGRRLERLAFLFLILFLLLLRVLRGGGSWTWAELLQICRYKRRRLEDKDAASEQPQQASAGTAGAPEPLGKGTRRWAAARLLQPSTSWRRRRFRRSFSRRLVRATRVLRALPFGQAPPMAAVTTRGATSRVIHDAASNSSRVPSSCQPPVRLSLLLLPRSPSSNLLQPPAPKLPKLLLVARPPRAPARRSTRKCCDKSWTHFSLILGTRCLAARPLALRHHRVRPDLRSPLLRWATAFTKIHQHQLLAALSSTCRRRRTTTHPISTIGLHRTRHRLRPALPVLHRASQGFLPPTPTAMSSIAQGRSWDMHGGSGRRDHKRCLHDRDRGGGRYGRTDRNWR